MKKLLFTIVVALMVIQVTGQSQPDVLIKFEKNTFDPPDTPRQACNNTSIQEEIQGKTAYRISNSPGNNPEIMIDSIFYFGEVYPYELRNNVEHFTYDEYGNKLTELYQHWENETLVNDEFKSFTWDEQMNMQTILHQNWEDEGWVDSIFVSFTYDDDGQLSVDLIQHWENEVWVNTSKGVYTWNENGNMMSSNLQQWENNAWVNSYLLAYIYDLNGNQLEYLLQHWENGTWMNLQLHMQTYDVSGNRLTQQQFIWEENTWENYYFVAYTYNNLNETTTITRMIWLNGDWLNYNKSNLTYDANGNLLTELSQYWDNDEWKNYQLESYTYDENNSKIAELNQYWQNDEWVNDEKDEYIFHEGKVNATAYDWNGSAFIETTDSRILNIVMNGERLSSNIAITMELFYTDITGIEEQNANTENEVIHCYPNPASNQINIEINPAWQTESCFVELFNQSGQRINSMETPSNSNSSSINVKDVAPGLYLLKLTSGKSASTRKVIISR
jgi:hypothetical protein